LEKQQWKKASKHHNGEGLESDLPSLTPASRAYADFIKQGKHSEAAALERLVVNKVWSKERLLEEKIITDEEAGCERCGATFESDFHRYYECSGNNHIDDVCIRKQGGLQTRPSMKNPIG